MMHPGTTDACSEKYRLDTGRNSNSLNLSDWIVRQRRPNSGRRRSSKTHGQAVDLCGGQFAGHKRPFGVLSGLRQRIELQVEAWFPGRNPDVTNIHRLIVSKLIEQCKEQSVVCDSGYATKVPA